MVRDNLIIDVNFLSLLNYKFYVDAPSRLQRASISRVDSELEANFFPWI